jgi:predicted RNA-binding protein with PUA-like domain
MAYWLMKSEPDAFSWNDLEEYGEDGAHWDGVRNYQARNFMRDEMKVGDKVFFYHSSVRPPHISGIAEVTREGYPDHTAWDEDSPYYDPKSSPDEPRWFMVDLKAVRPLRRTITLKELKDNPALNDMKVTQRGMRLSIQPVTDDEWDEVIRMENEGDD